MECLVLKSPFRKAQALDARRCGHIEFSIATTSWNPSPCELLRRTPRNSKKQASSWDARPGTTIVPALLLVETEAERQGLAIESRWGRTVCRNRFPNHADDVTRRT